ncbi:MAG: hypothetical protein R3F46_00025 [bacterium]
MQDNLLELSFLIERCETLEPMISDEHSFQHEIRFRLLAFKAFHHIFEDHFTQALIECNTLYKEEVLTNSRGIQRTAMEFLIYILGNIQGFGPGEYASVLISPEKLGRIWLELADVDPTRQKALDMLMLKISGQATITSCTRSNSPCLEEVLKRMNELFNLRLSSIPRHYRDYPSATQDSHLYWGHEKVKAMYQPDFRYEELLDLSSKEVVILCNGSESFTDVPYAIKAHEGFNRIIAWRFCCDIQPGQDLHIPAIEVPEL